MDCRLEGSDEWTLLPRYSIKDLTKQPPPEAVTALKKVTHIRVLFPFDLHGTPL